MAKSRPGIWQMSVKQRQTFLRNRGYNVNVDGKSGPQTFAAGWAYQHGMAPQAYNAHDTTWRTALWQHSGPKPLHTKTTITGKVPGGESYRPDDRGGVRTSAALSVAAKALARTHPVRRPKAPVVRKGSNIHAPNENKGHAGNTNPPGNAKNTNQSYGPPVGEDALPPGMELNQADIIAPKTGNIGTSLDPDQYANTAAGNEYDAQISDAKYAAAKLAAQAPSNLAQIDTMYGGVEAAQAAGAAQDVAAGKSIAGSQDALVQGLVASLGGAANQGSAGVAQAGVDASGYVRALDKIQQSTDQEIGTALKAEHASQKVSQGRLDSARAADLAHELATLQGQRGSAAAAARLDALKYNNDIAQQNYSNAQHIREVNLDTQQQAFQNKIAAQNAIIAAKAAGDAHLAAKLQNAYALQFPGQAFGKGTAAGKKGHTVTPSDIRQAAAGAQKNLMVKDPDTGRLILDPRLQHNVKALVTAVNAGFVGLHSTNKAAKAARDRILRMYGVQPQQGWNF